MSANCRRTVVATVVWSSMIVLGLGTGRAQQRENSPPKELKTTLMKARRFEDLFVFVREINLKVNDVIGDISRLEVTSDGKLLVLDRLGEKTWFFDRHGNLVKDINVDNDYPGVKWLPTGAWVGQNNDMLIQIDGSHSLFLFDESGAFKRAISVEFPPKYRDFVMDDEGFLYGYSTNAVELTVKKLSPDGKVLKKGGIFPGNYKNFISRFEGGGLVTDGAHNLYQFNVCCPEIYKLSLDLKLLKTFDESPAFFRQISEDYPAFSGDPAGFIRKADQLRRDATISFMIHLVKDSYLLAEYIAFGVRNGTHLGLIDLDGNLLTLNQITIGNPVVAARGILVYRAFQPEEDPQGKFHNPVLREYEFRFR